MLPALGLFLGGAALKGVSSLLAPDAADMYKDIPGFDDNKYLVEALNTSLGKMRDPRTMENSVNTIAKRLAPVFSEQIKALEVYRKNPALYQRGLEQAQQNYASNFRNLLDDALLAERSEKDQATNDVMNLSAMKLQSDQNLAMKKSEAKFADQSRFYDFLSEIGDFGAMLGSYKLGKG